MMRPACEIPPTAPSQRIATACAAGVPVLRGDRVELRAPRLSDFDAYAEILGSDRARHVGGPLDRAAAWDDFAQYVACWLLRGQGLWTVILRTDGTVLGFVTVSTEYDDPEVELGYMFRAGAEGRGYATEAAKLALAHARDGLGLDSLVSYIEPQNAASLAVASRLDARRDHLAEAAIGDATCHVFRHLPEGRA